MIRKIRISLFAATILFSSVYGFLFSTPTEAGLGDGDYSNYIDNGSFNSGINHWELRWPDLPEHFTPLSSCPDSYVNCIKLPAEIEGEPNNAGTTWIDQYVDISVAGEADLSVDYWHFSGGRKRIELRLYSPSGDLIINKHAGYGGTTPGCSSSNWCTVEGSTNVTPGTYRVMLYVWENWYASTDGYLDNVLLTVNNSGPGLPLLETMTLSGEEECPICTANSSVGDAAGIDTSTGNFTYKDIDLQIPAAGAPLMFKRNFASARVAMQTDQNIPIGSMGPGWVHNYEMSLNFTNTAISDTIELQTPGGSLLPFYIITPEDPNNLPTYEPYPGVTAELVEIDLAAMELYGGNYILTGYDQSEYQFNESGQLVKQKDEYGNEILFTYHTSGNGAGKLYRATQGGRYLQYSYNPQGLLSEVRDHTNRVVALDYLNGVLRLVQDPASAGVWYEHNDSNYPFNITAIQDRTGRYLRQIAYDSEGRAVEIQDGNNQPMVEVDFSIENTHVVTHTGVVMTHTYDTRGTLVNTTYSCDSSTPGCGLGNDVTYDGNFKTSQVSDVSGNVTDIVWSEGGSQPESITNALDQTTSMQYDGYNNLTTLTDSFGNTITNTYSHPNLLTFRTSTTNELGLVTVFTPTYNTQQNGVTVPNGLLLEQKGTDGVVTRYEYDVYGQMIKSIAGYGTVQPLVTEYTYDNLGRLQTTTDETGLVSLTVYDDLDQLVATIQNWTGSNPANWHTDCVTTPGTRDSNICTKYGYDTEGRLITTTDPLGRVNFSFYDNAARLYLTIQNYVGNHNGDPSVCNFANPDDEYNLCSLTTYEASTGRVVATTDPLGRVTRTEYDSLGRVKGTIVNSVSVTTLSACSFDPTRTNSDEDLCTVYTYDERGNVIITKDAAGRQTRTFYDKLNRTVATVQNWTDTLIVDEDDLYLCFESSSHGTDNDQNICSLTEYDGVGNVIVTTDETGVKTRTFYDDLYRVIATVQNWNSGDDPNLVGSPVNSPADCVYASNNINEENICSKVGYDPVTGRRVTSTNALGQTSLTVYDYLGRAFLTVANWDGVTVIDEEVDCTFNPAPSTSDTNLCSVTYYDSAGRASGRKDAKGFLSSNSYDGLSRVITSTRYLDNGTTLVQSSSTFDALGNTLTSTDAEGNTMSYQYDSLNRTESTTSAEGVIFTQTYNALGWVITSYNNYNYTTVNQYDDLGRLHITTDPEGLVTEYLYDVAGNQVTKIDANSVKTTYGYDDLNRLTSVLENDIGGPPTVDANVLTRYVYDVRGLQLHTIDARNIQQRITTYDVLGRRDTVTDALGNVTSYSYDAMGRLLDMTDGNNEVTIYTYDGLNRQETISYTVDAEMVSYTYDALGNVVTMSDGTGTTSYDYDDLSRPITITYPITGVVSYGYDKIGNRTSLTYPNNKVVTYVYDNDSRLTDVIDWDNQTTTYGYDLIGRLVTTELPNGVVTTNVYDTSDRLTGLSHSTITGTVASFVYDLDNVGNRLTVTETLLITDSASTTPSSTWVASSILTPTNGVSGDEYGSSVAIDGDVMVVGAVQGDATDTNSGYANVYRFNGSEWVFEQQLLPSNSGSWDQFGSAVDVEGNTIIVGAYGDWISSSIQDSGAVFVFTYNGSTWTEQTRLVASDAASGDRFGHAVALDGTRLVVGAYLDDDNGSGSGSAYIFEGSGASWTQTAKLTASDGHSDARFGRHVSLNGDTVFIGAYYTDAAGDSSGSVYIYEYDSGSWGNEQIVTPTALSSWDYFGHGVANDGNTLAIGVYGDDEYGSRSGSVYIYEHNGTSWVNTHVLNAADADSDDQFGYSVAVDETGNRVLVGARYEDTVATNAGAMYLFEYNGSSWSEAQKMMVTTGGANYDNLGVSVAIHSNTLVGGAIGYDGTGAAVPYILPSTVATNTQTTVIDYEYDDLYRLTEADYTGALMMTYQYEYDAVGNMKVVTETNGIDTTIEIRDFNDENQLTQAQKVTNGNTSHIPKSTFSYDGNGNLIQESFAFYNSEGSIVATGGSLANHYNQRNLLTKVQTTSPSIVTHADYFYDGRGNRVGQLLYVNNQPNSGISYVNNSVGLTQVLVQESTNGTTTSNLYGKDLISVEDSGRDTYVLGDALGSGRVELLENDWLSTTTYEPFGNLVARTGDKGTVYGFTGEQEDILIGTVYLRARYYSSRWRVFTSRDPFNGWLGVPASQHSYSYVHNNPILHTDPTGRWIWRGLYGVNPRGYEHRVIERYYEGMDGENHHKQVEYHITGQGLRPDMFNSVTGEVWEIEPIYNFKEAEEQLARYIVVLRDQAKGGDLTSEIKSRQFRGNFDQEYNWNTADFKRGRYNGQDWPGRYRQPHKHLYGYDLVADKVDGADGVIVYWLERNDDYIYNLDGFILNKNQERLIVDTTNFPYQPSRGGLLQRSWYEENQPSVTVEDLQMLAWQAVELFCSIVIPLPTPNPVPVP